MSIMGFGLVIWTIVGSQFYLSTHRLFWPGWQLWVYHLLCGPAWWLVAVYTAISGWIIKTFWK